MFLGGGGHKDCVKWGVKCLERQSRYGGINVEISRGRYVHGGQGNMIDVSKLHYE